MTLPLDGFTEVRRADHWLLFAQEVDGQVKAVVLAAGTGSVPLPGRWMVTAFAAFTACDAMHRATPETERLFEGHVIR